MSCVIFILTAPRLDYGAIDDSFVEMNLNYMDKLENQQDCIGYCKVIISVFFFFCKSGK